ncbi:enoyl-CoA hydratase/isomerase family protein [Aquabacterium humicola]|uniref:enoyl-CoA hydratase/isomerase family protein n=1 Tax=Aquabacterium humicola TaxID=3237377 RepID=UPI0025437BE4|nr:enoyl-CoA hydratase/isomerase family protein [Rubrivivax pictus]
MDTIHFEIREQVATLTLDKAATRNALSPAMREEIAEVVQTIKRDRDIRALVITGANGHFCSGGDLRNIATAGLDNQGWRERMQALHDWLRDLIALDRPVIAAVDGAAYGAGFGLALAADFVIATPRARFCVSFLKVGLVPDCGTFYTLPRIVGAQRAKELMLSAREVGADEAVRLGVAMELQPPERLLARAQQIAASFVHASPLAVSLVKRAVAAGGDLAAQLEFEADAQALAMGTAVHKDAVQDFLSKRPPRFSWPAA